MPRAVLVICDGLRADLVRPDLAPTICEIGRAGHSFAAHRAVFPAVTRASAAAIATGCRPGRHGLHGNTMALPTPAGPVVHDVGPPGFREAMRKALGRTLRVPTLAERLRPTGGVIVFSNVSPGAAYFHDPDGFGHVYHRAGSFGPGPAPVEAADHLNVSHDAAGDRAMTQRFCTEVLRQRRPALSILWLSDPDKTAHGFGLGAPEHLTAIRAADDCVDMVAQTVEVLRHEGEDILFLVGSDHGMETVRRVIPLETRLIEAGLKRDAHSTDLAVAPQGLAALIYTSPQAADRIPAITDFLLEQDFTGRVFVGEGLREAGLEPENNLAIAVTGAWTDAPNRFGIPGQADALLRTDNPDLIGTGQHGGLGRYEQHPFLIAVGRGFATGATRSEPSSITDISPTVLHHLGQPAEGMDGRPLQLT